MFENVELEHLNYLYIPQLPSQNLSHICFWERISKYDFLWYFIIG